MCLGSVTHMHCRHFHSTIGQYCRIDEERCSRIMEGQSHVEEAKVCGNCEAEAEANVIRSDFKDKYDVLMKEYQLAHQMGNTEELGRIRSTLRQNASQENREVSAVRKIGRAKAKLRTVEK